MDSDDEMVEEAVEGTSISLGPGEEAPRARNAEGVAGCDPHSAGPQGRHCPLCGWPAARLRQGPDSHRHAAGSAHCAAGAGRGQGSAGPELPGGHGCSIPPATACIPTSELRTLPCTLAFPFRGWKVGVRKSTVP